MNSNNKSNKARNTRKTYKGTTNYFNGLNDNNVNDIDQIEEELIPDDENTAITIDVKPLDEKNQQAGRNDNSSSNKNKNNNKKTRVGSLPYREMFNYYVRGEKVIKGGVKYPTTPSYEDVAERFNCSYTTVASYGSEHNWVEKRKRYRQKLSSEFSFYGQMAADVNGQVLNGASTLIKKINEKLEDPTFLPKAESIIVAPNGGYYVEDEETGELYPLPFKPKESEVVQIEKLTKALESINRICNNTVQVEIDNANLLDEMAEEKDPKKAAEARIKRIEELTSRLNPSRSKKMSKREMADRKKEAYEKAAKLNKNS